MIAVQYQFPQPGRWSKYKIPRLKKNPPQPDVASRQLNQETHQGGGTLVRKGAVVAKFLKVLTETVGP